MKKSKIIYEYYQKGDVFLIENILFCKDTFKAIEQAKNIIITPRFAINLKHFLKTIESGYNYPKAALEKVKVILNNIKARSIGLDEEINECFDILANIKNFSEDKYLEEFTIKKNDLADFRKNEFYIWKKDDINESICFDHLVYIAFGVDEDRYNRIYKPIFVLSKNYIYALKKIMYVFPELFQIEEYKKRAEEIIKLNLKMLEHDPNAVISYLMMNYHHNIISDFDVSQLTEFKREIELVAEQLKHLKKDPFDISEFRCFYQMLMLERYLYFDIKFDIHTLDPDAILEFINYNMKNSLIGQIQKEKLIDIIDKIEDIDKQYYIDELEKVEIIFEDDLAIKQFHDRAIQKDKFKSIFLTMLNYDNSQLMEIGLTKIFDLENFEAYMVSDEKFEELKKYLKETEYPISVLRYIRDYPTMFIEESIYDRTMEGLKECNDEYTKVAIKKLKRLKERL